MTFTAFASRRYDALPGGPRPTAALISPDDVPTRDRRPSRRQLARERAYFEKVRLAERAYGIALRRIARSVGHVVSAFSPDDPAHLAQIVASLESYSRMLHPWARAAAARMIAEVARRDDAAWRRLSDQLGRDLRAELTTAPTGDLMRRLQDEQVALITSIPIDAARRVQALARDLVSGGRRYDEVVPAILASGGVAASRATLIARTETARAASSLTRARAEHVGSEGYVWRTARDVDVRPSHRRMEGKFCRWDDPPLVEPGHRYHAGGFPNCRCWPEPVIPENLD